MAEITCMQNLLASHKQAEEERAPKATELNWLHYLNNKTLKHYETAADYYIYSIYILYIYIRYDWEWDKQCYQAVSRWPYSSSLVVQIDILLNQEELIKECGFETTSIFN